VSAGVEAEVLGGFVAGTSGKLGIIGLDARGRALSEGKCHDSDADQSRRRR
jgi:hypothetical protein